MITLLGTHDPCDECAGQDDVLLVAVVVDGSLVESLALCGQCRIKTEAVLRGSRKAGKRIPKWGPSPDSSER